MGCGSEKKGCGSEKKGCGSEKRVVGQKKGLWVRKKGIPIKFNENQLRYIKIYEEKCSNSSPPINTLVLTEDMKNMCFLIPPKAASRQTCCIVGRSRYMGMCHACGAMYLQHV